MKKNRPAAETDMLLRATGGQGAVRVFLGITTGLAEEARRRHNTLPTATAALGRTLTAAALMGMTLKGNEILTLRVAGDGPLGAIVAVAGSEGKVRGYVQEPGVHLPLAGGKLDVGGAVGKEGYLYVTRDLGLKEPYTGSAPLVSGEIAEDLANYFAVSEQTPTAVSLGVLVDTDNSVRAAGGFIVQALPGIAADTAAQLEENVLALPPFSEMVAQGWTADRILGGLMGKLPWTVQETLVPEFRCRCSREGIKELLLALGRDEIQDLIDSEGQAEVKCHFCNEKYILLQEELQQLLLALDRSAATNKMSGKTERKRSG